MGKFCIKNYDVDEVDFDEAYISPDYTITKAYFNVPVEWLDGKYPDAEFAFLSVEYHNNPRDKDIPVVQITPSSVAPDGKEIIDWVDVSLPLADIYQLRAIADFHRRSKQVEAIEVALCHEQI